VGWPLGDDAGTVDVSVSAVCARAASTVVPAVRAVNGLSERSGREVLPPDIGHALRELPFIEAEAFRDRLMHVALADRSDAAATPDVVHPLVQLARAQAEPALPHPGHAQVRGDLQNAADIEHNRLDDHDTHDVGCPRGKVK
jgi:hypothetical protein